jgi:hypothetical protein
MHVNPFYSRVNRVFEWVEYHFEACSAQRRIGSLLVLVFFFSLAAIQLQRWGLLPESLAGVIPLNHLEAIHAVFSVLLFFEIIGLLFSLVCSVSISVGKQVEILSLVMLRDIFKMISDMSEPLRWEEVATVMPEIASLGTGALAIFIILGFYYRNVPEQAIQGSERDTASFIGAKKIIALLLLPGFILIVAFNAYSSLVYGTLNRSFETIYTLLVFSDILIMLLSMRYGASYRFAFRNSGFAVATLLIRVALITPPHYSALIGVGSALLILGIRLAFNHYTPSRYQLEREYKRGRRIREQCP